MCVWDVCMGCVYAMCVCDVCMHAMSVYNICAHKTNAYFSLLYDRDLCLTLISNGLMPQKSYLVQTNRSQYNTV
jgi:hypothetical protein